VDPVVFALVAASMGALWWRHYLRAGQARATRALGTVFDGDAEVVLHVATHEARAREQPLTSVHVLYGLLQDETIASALRETGSDPAALEDRVHAALDQRIERDPDDGARVYGYAAHHAHASERSATPRDLWAYLRGSDAARLIEPSGIAKVLFKLCHGSELDARADGTADVHVVLRNDDYTTQQFVTHVLEEVFGLDASTAAARMMQTHTEGRTVIGRFRPDDARAKIEQVRASARASGFPLWIGYEPI
jgi:ATP-dependent Clp protease adaptor protein ClpS